MLQQQIKQKKSNSCNQHSRNYSWDFVIMRTVTYSYCKNKTVCGKKRTWILNSREFSVRACNCSANYFKRTGQKRKCQEADEANKRWYNIAYNWGFREACHDKLTWLPISTRRLEGGRTKTIYGGAQQKWQPATVNWNGRFHLK